MEEKKVKRYSLGEEIGSAVTHGVGTLLSIAGLVLLILRAAWYAPAEYKVSYIVGFVIFGVSLIILYISSTLYHALTNHLAKKIKLRQKEKEWRKGNSRSHQEGVPSCRV